jgi:hypothetical protein
MNIDGIFDEFMPQHIGNFPFFPWPAPGSDEWAHLAANWKRAIIRNGFRLEPLLEASSRLSEEEIGWEKHFPRLVKIAHQVCREKGATDKDAPPNTRAAIEYASRDCLDCSSTGFTTRYRHTDGPTPGRQNQSGYEQVFYCTCPMGRWAHTNHRATSPDTIARIPDLAAYPSLRLREVGDETLDNPQRYRRGAWDSLNDRPEPVEIRRRSVLRAPLPITASEEPKALPAPTPTRSRPRGSISGAPAGLTEGQEIFYGLMGRDHAAAFNRLPSETRREWLAEFREGFDRDTAEAMIGNLARIEAESEELIFI